MKFLHSMIRTNDPEATKLFYTRALGLKLIRKTDDEQGRYSLYFYGNSELGPMVEITHNWDQHEYQQGNQFGHLAFETKNIYKACEYLMALDVEILRPPRDGRMAFIKDPNGISIELLQSEQALEPKQPWTSMKNQGQR